MAIVALIRISDPLHLSEGLANKKKNESFCIYQEGGVTWLSALIEAESRKKLSDLGLSEVMDRARDLFRYHGKSQVSKMEIWYPIDDELRCLKIETKETATSVGKPGSKHRSLKIETKETTTLVEKPGLPEEISAFIDEV